MPVETKHTIQRTVRVPRHIDDPAVKETSKGSRFKGLASFYVYLIELGFETHKRRKRTATKGKK